MAKLYITREPEGTWRLRGQRLAGKELAAHKTVKGVNTKDIQKEVAKLMAEVAPRKIIRTII